MSTVPVVLVLPLVWLTAGQPSAGPGSIDGRVVDSESGTPIAGARVLLYIPTPSSDGLALVPRETTSDEVGTFQYVGIPPGTYQLAVLKDDYIRPVGSSESVFVEVSGERGPADILYQLRRSGVITGRIFDRDGQPAVRATIMALHATPTVRGFKNATPAVQVNRDGRFRLTGLDDGQYLIKAWLEDERDAGGPTVLSGIAYYPGTPDVAAARSIAVIAGQVVDNVLFGLATPSLFEVSGTVVRSTGEPVANATVLVTGNPLGVEQWVSVPDRVKTAPDGTFVIRRVFRGDYLIRAADGVVTPAREPDADSSHYVASSPAAPGGPLLTETRDGLKTEYRFERVGVALSVRDQDVSGLRLTVSR